MSLLQESVIRHLMQLLGPDGEWKQVGKVASQLYKDDSRFKEPLKKKGFLAWVVQNVPSSRYELEFPPGASARIRCTRRREHDRAPRGRPSEWSERSARPHTEAEG